MIRSGSNRRARLTLLIRICVRCFAAAAAIVLCGCGNSVLLDERFHDTRLIEWTAVDDPDTIEGPSDWRVQDDARLHQLGNVWGRRGDFIGRWYGTYLIAGEAGWKDYKLSVKATPIDDDGFGVVFRYQDSEHFYRLLFLQDGLSGGPITRLDRREGADYTELWSKPNGYRPGIETMIEVSVEGDVIKASVNGRPLLEVKDGSYKSYKRGKIGLFCYAQNSQAFDDVRVVSE
ncbi:MAG: hypothetical protein AABN34_01075 [Acidobacteriota bacterium]